MQKIIVVKTERTAVDILSLSYEEIYDIVFKLGSDLAKFDINYVSILNLFLEIKRNRTVFPSLRDISDVIMHFIYHSKYSIPHVKLTNLESDIPWVYAWPKDIEPGHFRLKTSSRKVTSTTVTPSWMMVDVSGFTIGEHSYTTDKYKNALMNIIWLHKWYSSAARNFIKNNRLAIPSPKVLSLKILTESEYPVIKNELIDFMRKYINIRQSHHSLSELLSEVFAIRDIDTDILLTDNIGDLQTKTMDNYKQVLHDKIKKSELQIKDIVKKCVIVKYISVKYKDRNINNETGASAFNINMSLIEILSKFSAAEVKDIELYYSDYIAIKNAQLHNKCPHVKLVDDLFYATKIDKKIALLKELEALMIMPADNNEYITCNLCKFNIICPHQYKKYKMEFVNAEPRDIDEMLSTYVDETVSESFIGFCRICMEEIAYYTLGELVIDGQRTLYKRIFSYIWTSAINIYQTILFSKYVPVYDFCVIMVDTVLPIIISSDIPDLIQSLNTFLKDDILTPKLQLYSLMFIYSVILHMIRLSIVNPDRIYVKVKLTEKVSGTEMSKYATVILARFENMHRHITRSVQDIKNDKDIMNMFYKVYTRTSRADNAIFMIKDSGCLDVVILNAINATSMFKYAYSLAIMLGDLKPDAEHAIIFKTIFGVEVNEFLRHPHMDLMEHLYMPTSDRKEAKLYRQYVEYMKTNTLSYDIVKEESMLMSRRYESYGAELECNKVKKKSSETSTRLSLIFDKNGNTHNWTKYLATDKKIRSRKELLPEGHKFVTFVCDICDTRMDNRLEYDNDTLKVAVKAVSTFKTFFMFYAVKCPENVVHKFVKAVCEFCGITRKILAGHDMDSAKTYYKKYKSAFDKAQVIVPPPEVKYLPYSESSAVEDNGSIATVADIAKVPKHMIEYLGRTENIKEDQILMAGIQYPDTVYATSILRLKNYILIANRLYNIYKYKTIIKNVQDRADIQSVYNSLNFTEVDIRKLEDLPEIPSKFLSNSNSMWYKLKFTPEQVYTYTLNILCQLICWIKTTTNMPLAKYITRYILTEDKYTQYTDIWNTVHFNRFASEIKEDYEDIEYEEEIGEDEKFYEIDAEYLNVGDKN